MGKFRSKLKRRSAGKSWGHGQSATSNPQNTKYRSKAQSRFFQSNLSLAPQPPDSSGALTQAALYTHDARQSYLPGQESAPTVNDIAVSLKSFNIDGTDENMSQSQNATFKTFQTFASNYSACTNMSFNKLLNGFRSDSPLHKEMLAILAALTEVIKQRGGTESSTEYFLVLMETLEAASENKEIVASLSLLNMGIRSVPEAVLRKKFSDTATLLLDHMKRFVDTDNQNVLKNVLGSLSVLLRAQEYSIWTLSSTLEIFDAILSFAVHLKPKIRKAAQQAVTSIVHGSCFMQTQKSNGEETSNDKRKISNHPASGRVAKFCIKQFRPENIANGKTVVLHTLGLLQDTINGFKSDDIKTICECLLSIMTAANVLVRTNCFQTIHSLFASKTTNLNAILTGKLISALYEFRPDKSDVRQTLAWLTVLKEGHICLSTYDITLCVNSLPKLIDICANDLWISERVEIVSGSSNVIKELFLECIKPGCETKQLADVHRASITRIINHLTTPLAAPFGHVATQVILTFATVFETIGKFFFDELRPALVTIGSRYDIESSLRLQIEHAILVAIPSMGPEHVLQAIPLTDTSGDVSLSRSWILPLLRESITGSSLEFFRKFILQLAAQCYKKWRKYKAAGNFPLAHTHELLFCQLWGLFPGFCRHPIDLFNFRFIAKTLGTALNENREIRSAILDGLKELMTNADDDGKNEISKFSKNFLPILFNIYSTKPNGSYENEIRRSTLAVIQEYFKITPKSLLGEMFALAKQQYVTAESKSFLAESLFDIIEHLAVYQSVEELKDLFENFVQSSLLKQKSTDSNNETFKLPRNKAYEFLANVLCSTNGGCVEFVAQNLPQIQNVVLKTGKINCKKTQASRLKCIQCLIEKQQRSLARSGLVKKIITEIASYSITSTKDKDNVAMDLVIKIADIYKAKTKLNNFAELILACMKTGEIQTNRNLIIFLKTILRHYSGCLTVPNIEFLLTQILPYLVGKNRTEVEASVAFLIVFIKTLPAPLVANHLPTIMKSISSMVPDTRRYCRIHIGYILRKLCKRFSAEEIVKLVPGNDEVTHKKLKNIRKEQNREKRHSKAVAKDEQSSDDDSDGLAKKSYGIEDILDDSESELDNDLDDNSSRKPKGKKAKHETYIQEDPEGILDFTDIRSLQHIKTTKPEPSKIAAKIENKAKQQQDDFRGFKLAQDGRIIIADQKKGKSGHVSEDDDDDVANMDLNGSTDTAKGTGKKRQLDSDSESNDETPDVSKAKKRKASSALSMASGKTGATGNEKYVTGGKGIHRTMPTAESVKSGASRMSMATTKAASTAYGNEYRSKKAKGDIKKKGKMDPFAYIPLSRNSLNKRKRAKNAGQFKSIVKGARKGAAAGSRNKMLKKQK